MPRRYFSLKWVLVYGYLVVVFALDPQLPKLIAWAAHKWSYQSVSDFVLLVAAALALSLIAYGGVLFFTNRRKFVPYMLITGSGVTASYLFYRFYIPNPYELTHVPEYTFLGALVMLAMRNHQEPCGTPDPPPDPPGARSPLSQYGRALAFTLIVSVVDELYHGVLPNRYFTYYDLFLNGLGAVVGLALVWTTGDREPAAASGSIERPPEP